ncbi:petrobactin biosynthesis protein AsbA [Agaricicola taiwanensis]|uniref:Petrobactin biosynthesis protein AsbA n=1 Tax=Agaricicola taiwanensis TaxID=591372 RepID=A0A8J2YJT4_9RHOB|nr:IucA/IucC family protein [Agaricicola taiwanensis]GGE48646.1 petrobactin biosynthesis protein AsbA [Agaricicola taiwanensis]
MTATAQQLAEQVTFQSYANCYQREIDPGIFIAQNTPAGSAGVVEWPLPALGGTMRVEVLSRSLCGPQRFGRASIRRNDSLDWQTVEPLNALTALVHETYRQFGPERARTLRSCELELLYRVFDSYHSLVRYLEAHDPAASVDDFISAEQSLVFGHWLHPTPKSRQGMACWQQPAYAPELRGRFQLIYFAARAPLVAHDSAGRHNAPRIVSDMLGRDLAEFRLAEDECAIPMHPLQAQALLLDPAIRGLMDDGALRLLGAAGPTFSATSSVRTVYSADVPYMLKFSLPVRITNSVRLNRRPELDAGVLMARLFQRTRFCDEHPQFKVIHDPAYITLTLPGRPESGFEVIFRDNPFGPGHEKEGVTLAALTAEPMPGQISLMERIIRDLARGSGAGLADISRRWFAAYLDCVLDPLIGLYDTHGVALEAHQQNSLLDVSRGYPRAYYYRDNQGFYLSTRYRHHLDAFIPEAAAIPSLYFDDEDIQDRFAYYLIINQIFSVISRIGHDGLIAETELMGVLRDRLSHFARTMRGSGRDFAHNFLEQPTVAAKGNLMTRLFDIDELEAQDEKAIYTRLPNPLFAHSRAPSKGEDVAVAS